MYSKIILIERTRSEHCSYFENSDRKKKLKKTNYDVSSHFQSTNENRNRIRSDLHSQLIRTYLMRISFFFFFFFNESGTQILSCSFDFCVLELSFWLYLRLYRHVFYFKIKSEFLSYTRNSKTRNFT